MVAMVTACYLGNGASWSSTTCWNLRRVVAVVAAQSADYNGRLGPVTTASTDAEIVPPTDV